MSDNPFWDEINEVLEEGLREMYATEGFLSNLKDSINTINDIRSFRKLIKDRQKTDRDDWKMQVLNNDIRIHVIHPFLKKLLKKHTQFSINKEIYDIIVNYANTNRQLVSDIVAYIMEVFERDKIYGNAKKYLFKTPDIERDTKLINEIKEAGTKFKEDVSKYSLIDHRKYLNHITLQETIESGITSTEEIIITSKDIEALFLPDDTISLMKRYNAIMKKAPKVINGDPYEDEPNELFLKYKRYIEIYQPYPENIEYFNMDEIKAPILAYCYYINHINDYTVKIPLSVYKYNDGIYQILKYAYILKDNEKQNTLFAEIYKK